MRGRMRNRVEGVQEKILACAIEEFLEKGYTDASLRTIAANAGTSTNSIYVRFKDKEGLFCAIVEPAVNELMDMFRRIQETFHDFDSETQKREMGKYSSNGMLDMIDYIYDHLDEFRLLLDSSYGTRYQHFVDELVRLETEYTYKYMEATGSFMEMEETVSKDFFHIVDTAYFEGIFEVIRHEMSREKAKQYVTMLGEYHHAGFQTICKSKADKN